MNFVYSWVALRTTEWENHRTHKEHQSVLVWKLVFFYCINHYISLFYLAFFRKDMAEYVGLLVVLFHVCSL